LKKWFSVICFAVAAAFASQAHASKAMNFNFTDTKGKTHQLSDYAGKWVLVNFWAPWCPRCKMEFPDLNDMDARNDFVVIGVVMDYGIDQNSAHSTIQRYNLRFPNVLGGNRREPGNPAMQVGPVDYYPTSYLYAPNGEIVMFVPGVISKQKLTAFMNQYDQSNPTAIADKDSPAPAVVSTPPSSGIKKATLSSSTKNASQDKKKVTQY
jgi:thiol-disulfide isomerase/thioredoxin